MSATRMAKDIVDLLAADLELAFAFYCAASEIVDDFEDYGPQLMGSEDGEYDDSTPIGKLQSARNVIIERLQAASAERSSPD
jgi:hypothetical protein